MTVPLAKAQVHYGVVNPCQGHYWFVKDKCIWGCYLAKEVHFGVVTLLMRGLLYTVVTLAQRSPLWVMTSCYREVYYRVEAPFQGQVHFVVHHLPNTGPLWVHVGVNPPPLPVLGSIRVTSYTRGYVHLYSYWGFPSSAGFN